MTEATPAQRRLGFALTALCALGFAVLASLVRLIYEGGADAVTVTLFRAGASAAIFATLAAARGEALLPPRGVRRWTILVGLLWLTGT